MYDCVLPYLNAKHKELLIILVVPQTDVVLLEEANLFMSDVCLYGKFIANYCLVIMLSVPQMYALHEELSTSLYLRTCMNACMYLHVQHVK